MKYKSNAFSKWNKKTHTHIIVWLDKSHFIEEIEEEAEQQTD